MNPKLRAGEQSAFPIPITGTGAGDVYHSCQVVQGGGGMSMRSYALVALVSVMANSANGWPSDSDWPEIVRRAGIGADEIVKSIESHLS